MIVSLYNYQGKDCKGLKFRGLTVFRQTIVIVLLTLLMPGCERPGAPEDRAAPDLGNHPVYSKYELSARDNVIHMGIQPLGIPIGVITEAMRRDRVLEQELSGLGLAIRFHPFLKGADVNYFLEKGSLQVAVGGDMPAITAAANQDILVVSLVKKGFTSIVADGPMMVGELRGRRIGYPYGGNAHYALLDVLSSHGLAEADVRLIRLNVNEMAEALSKGKIDAFAAWEPFPTMALMKDSGFAVIHKSISTSYLYMDRGFQEKHPKAARLVLASQIRAMRWMDKSSRNLLAAARWNLHARAGFSKIKQVLTERQIADLTVAGLLGITKTPSIPEAYILKDGMLYREFVFLRELGKVPSSVRWGKVRDSFDTGYINEILMDPARYRLQAFDFREDGDGVIDGARDGAADGK